MKAVKAQLALTVADTQYAYQLPKDARRFRVHLRDWATFRLAYEPGKVATPTVDYETIPASAEKYEDDITGSLYLYLASFVALKVAEIEVWVAS